MTLWTASQAAPVRSVEVLHLRVTHRQPVRFFGTMRPAPVVQLESRIQQLEADVKELKDFNTKFTDGLREAKDIIDEDAKFRRAKASLVQIICIGAILFLVANQLRKTSTSMLRKHTYPIHNLKAIRTTAWQRLHRTTSCYIMYVSFLDGEFDVASNSDDCFSIKRHCSS